MKQTKISSLPTMNSKFSKTIFKDLLNIFSVLQYISKRAQSRVCEFHRGDRASSALGELKLEPVFEAKQGFHQEVKTGKAFQILIHLFMCSFSFLDIY